ncbi:MAG: cytochrome C oxidase subunit IV family protein [Pirellulaceae bacterium]
MNEHATHGATGHDPAGHEADHEHEHEHEHEHGHGGIGKYLAVTVALIILTAISFTAGSSPAIMGTPAVGWTIMLAVSCCKALLVMLFFMHLLWEADWKYVLTIPASIMSVFLLLMLVPDILGRTAKYSEERWLQAPVPAQVSPEGTDENRKSDLGHPTGELAPQH